MSDKLISANRLYEKVAGLEEMARDRYLDTTTCLPNGGVNPSAIRYGAQMDERTAFKHMIADAPTVDAIPIEWINEWCLSQNLTYIRLAVEKMLEDWEVNNDRV